MLISIHDSYLLLLLYLRTLVPQVSACRRQCTWYVWLWVQPAAGRSVRCSVRRLPCAGKSADLRPLRPGPLVQHQGCLLQCRVLFTAELCPVV